jgi:Family of unknown function (DUF6447)
MTIIKIDDKDYDTETMSDTAKNNLVHLQTIDMEMHRLNMQLAIHQTAKGTYLRALKEELDQSGAAASSLPN